MSSDGNMNSRGGGGVDLGKTEEMPAGGPLSSRSRVNVSSKPVPAARPSEPLQLADGQSSGESQAAYAAGPKPIPASRHNVGSDPAPAVIVDGAQAHTYEPLETPPPPSSTRGGLYIAPVPVPAIAAPAPERPGPQRAGRTGTVPMSRPFSTPQFASPVPEARGRARSETVVITMPGRKTGPSSKEKVLAFVVMLVIVALLGIILLLWQGLGKNPASGASPEPPRPTEATAAQVVPQATVVAEPTFVAPPPVAVVAAPAAMEDAGKKLPKKH